MLNPLLRTMTESEFEVFFERSVREYVQTISKEFGVSLEAAQKVGEEQTVKLLSQGLKTPNHFCYKILDPATGEPAGDLWVAITTPFDVKTLYVYQISIEERHRGKGLAKKALQELESLARSHGTERMSLNVFDSNTVAKGLYQSLGFVTTNMHMQKAVNPCPN